MPRRLLAVLSVCAVAALTVTAVAFAHGGGSGSGDHHGSEGHKRTTHARHSGQPTDFLTAGLLGPAVTSLAQRLDVDPATLRSVIKAVAAEEADKRLQAAGLTPDEVAAVKACRTHGRHASKARAGCHGATFKSGAAKLKAAAKTKPDLAALKTDLATSLASKIGKTPDEVLTAVRAELDARLTQAVQAGWLTQKGHDLALACFDDPNSCDLKALKAEVRWPGRRDDNGSTPTPGDTSTTTTPGSTTMSPGGRSTSTPLR